MQKSLPDKTASASQTKGYKPDHSRPHGCDKTQFFHRQTFSVMHRWRGGFITDFPIHNTFPNAQCCQAWLKIINNLTRRMDRFVCTAQCRQARLKIAQYVPSARFYALKDKCWEKSKEKPLSSLPKARAQQRGARNSIQLSKNFLLAVYQPETLNPTHAAQAHPGGPFDH